MKHQTDVEQLERSGVQLLSRRSLLKGSALLGGTALLSTTPEALSDGRRTLVVDVAADGPTYRLNRSEPTAVGQLPTRGDTFIFNGKLFPKGTIERGLTNPNQPGSIGTWVCRGWIQAEDFPAQVPHAATVQLFLFDDGSSLATEGLEGGVTTVRAVVGGTGRFSGASGGCTEEEMGTNESLITVDTIQVPAPNFRFVFRLR